MHDNVLKIFSINLQPVPGPRNVIESSNELIFLMWVAVTLPSNEVRTSSVARECKQLFSVSHNRINKKCPALVRYIHKGEKRQRALSSIKLRLLFETSKCFGEKVHK